MPSGLLHKDEIPDNMGLIYYNPETGKLLKKKNALYREIEEPVGVYKYIIFSRIEQDRNPFYSSQKEYAKAYLEDRAEKNYIGTRLKSKMAHDLADAYERLERLKSVEEEIELLKRIKKVMNENGIYCWFSDDDYAEKLEDALKVKVAPKDLKFIKDELTGALSRIEQIEKGEENG